MMRGIGDWTRTNIEDYLFHEAALLDEWRLPEWFDLFAEDCHYFVPNMGEIHTLLPTRHFF